MVPIGLSTPGQVSECLVLGWQSRAAPGCGRSLQLLPRATAILVSVFAGPPDTSSLAPARVAPSRVTLRGKGPHASVVSWGLHTCRLFAATLFPAVRAASASQFWWIMCCTCANPVAVPASCGGGPLGLLAPALLPLLLLVARRCSNSQGGDSSKFEVL